MSIPTTSGRWSSGLAYAAALIFTIASAGTNLVYGWQKGLTFPAGGPPSAVTIVFALSWPAVIGSVERRNLPAPSSHTSHPAERQVADNKAEQSKPATVWHP